MQTHPISLLKKILSYLFWIAIIVLTSYICFYNLGKASFENWDEAWYADMTRTLMRNKDFVVLYWNRMVSLDKPPFYIWLSALWSALFGLSELSVRLTSALAGCATILLAVWYSNKKWGKVAAFLTFVTLALNNVYIWRVRTGNIDALVTFFIFVSYFLILSSSKRKYTLLGILFSVIYLTKASLVAFPIAIFLLYELFFKREKVLSHIKDYALTFGIMLVICGLWLFLGFLTAGPSFPLYFLFSSDQDVSHVSPFLFKMEYLSFAYYSLQRRFFYLFVIGIVFLISQIKKKEQFLLFCFSTFLLILLSFTERNNNWYLAPSMPFWALTIGYATSSSLRLIERLAGKKIRYGSCAVLLLLTGYIAYKTFTVNIGAIISSDSTKYQADSGKKVDQLVPKNETVIRLDVLYPTSIYYTDRKILSLQPGVDTSGIFINKPSLEKAMAAKTLRYFVGKTSDAKNFMREYSKYEWKTLYKNEEESILFLK